MNAKPCNIFEFGPFRVDPAERLLLRNGTPVHITDKAFDTLLILLQRHGHLVERSELIAAIWGEAFVEDGNLTVTISMLRKALDENANRRYIKTVPRRGYRFVADIHRINSSPSDVRDCLENADLLPKAQSTPRRIWQSLPNQELGLLAFGLILIVVSIGALVHAHRASKAGPLGIHSLVAAAPLSAASPYPYGTRDWEAYRLYQEGRYLWTKRTEEGLRQSIRLFQQAIARDPQYAAAYVGMAESYMKFPTFGKEPAQEIFSNAKAACTEALRLDNSLPEAHTCLGILSFLYEWNWSNAEVEFRQVLAKKPDDVVALFEHAKALAVVGRLDEALEEVRRAQRFEPASLRVNNELGRIYYWHRNYDEAISTFRHVLELDPNYWQAHTRLGKTYLAKGDYREAVYELQEGRRLAGRNPYIDGLLGYAEALNGDTKQSLRIFEQLRGRSRREYVPAFSMVLISLGVGDRQQSLEWLLKAYDDRSEHLAYAKVDPLLDPFRSDPQFVNLLNQMGLSHITSATNLSGPNRFDFPPGI